jgi:vacuolar-type H+-ATPase subunit C/Vma6
MLAKSFLSADRQAALRAVTTREELVSLIFGAGDAPYRVEGSPGETLEERIKNRTASQILHFLNTTADTRRDVAFIIVLLRSYEYSDLKIALSHIYHNREAPRPVRLGRFATVNFDAYPDLAAMLHGSPLGFFVKRYNDAVLASLNKRCPLDLGALYAELDKHYYDSLWAAILRAGKSATASIRKLITEEIALFNATAALRLRTYYGLSDKEIENFFIRPEKNAAFYSDAWALFNFSLDTFSDWSKWRRRAFLNKEESGSFWRADPRHFQNEAALYLFRLATKLFRRVQFAPDTLAMFIKMKLFEEELLCSAAEALQLGLTGGAAFDTLWGTL